MKVRKRFKSPQQMFLNYNKINKILILRLNIEFLPNSYFKYL